MKKCFPLLWFKYKDQIEGVLLEDKLSSTAEVLCKERKKDLVNKRVCSEISLCFLFGAYLGKS